MRAGHRAALAAAIAILVLGCGDESLPPMRDVAQHADWWLAAPAGDAEVVLDVYAGEDGCHAYRGVDVTEFEDEVRITAHVDFIGDAGCVGGRQVERVDVPLAEPLDDRALTGCRAPEQGLRDPKLEDHDETGDCRDRRGPGP